MAKRKSLRWSVWDAVCTWEFGSESLSESVKCRLSKCRFRAEFEKLGKYSRWGETSKRKSKKPWTCIFTLLLCGNRRRFSENAWFCLSTGAPTIANKMVQKNIQNTKVAFDTVRSAIKISAKFDELSAKCSSQHRDQLEYTHLWFCWNYSARNYTYHPFQNHYTNEIVIFEFFRRLQLQLSGVFRSN